MKFYRHKNGNGQKFGLAEVDTETYLRRDSFTGDTAVIWQSRFENSSVQGNSTVLRSLVMDSAIGELQRKEPIIVSESRLFKSLILKGSVFGSTLKSVDSYGHIRNADLENCFVGAGVFITGGKCRNLKINVPLRIGEGVWERLPRFVCIPDTDIWATESINKMAYIGCTPKPMATWIKKRKMFAKAVGWTEEQTEFLKNVFEKWLETDG